MDTVTKVPTTSDEGKSNHGVLNFKLTLSHFHIIFIIGIEQTRSTASCDIYPKDICKIKRKGQNWIACKTCGQWFHCSCVGLTMAKVAELPHWNCNNCTS